MKVRDVKRRNRELRGEVAKHKAELEKLRQQDPEFYEYLKVCGIACIV